MGYDNNTGMHFVRYNHYGQYDDLSYYNKNSEEGRRNAYYSAKYQLEQMGDYMFSISKGFLDVYVDDIYEGYYEIYTYPREETETIRKVTKKGILYLSEEKKMIARVHNSQKVIYVLEDKYNEDSFNIEEVRLSV